MLTNEQILKIIKEEPEGIIALIQSLYRQNEELRQRIEHLESIINKNSSNSSKPPSSDGFKKQKRTNSLRIKTGKKPGGQKGHEGNTLKKTENPDHIIRCPVTKCEVCNINLSFRKNDDIEKRQVIDIPPIKTEVTEYQADVKECPCCGTRNIGEFPLGVKDSVQYGPRIKGMAIYFMNQQFIPYKRTQECFKDIFDCSISTGSLYNFQKECFTLLEDTELRTIADLKSSAIMHADESGFYVNGARNWLHCYSSRNSTYYSHHPKRGKEAMDNIGMLQDYEGRCIHDHWDSYFFYDCLHGLCNSHHLRELKFLFEVKKEIWALKMKDCLLAIKASVQYYMNKRRLPSKLIRYYMNRYRRILKSGLDHHKSLPLLKQKGTRGRKVQRLGKNMLDRLKEKENNVLAFMYDFNVPFDNNQGERDIRMVKVKQKISGCCRSPSGGDFFCRIRGFISTLKKRELNILESIYDTYLGFVPI